jgi:3-methyladenine DNA glycosylase AlkD
MSDVTKQILSRLHQLGDADDATQAQRFFKTGPGEYGEGDRFLGIRVPVIRRCVREYRYIELDDALEILRSPLHEARLLALLILVDKYRAAGSTAQQRVIYRAYLDHTAYINNWDLVDSSAEHIVGAYLFDRDRGPIYSLACSKSLWERRIAVLATFHFIKHQQYDDTLAVARLLLSDEEDLIHKAAGWMLREVGKRDRPMEERFLKKNYRLMPRTMLRYAIERLPENVRRAYLRGEVR